MDPGLVLFVLATLTLLFMYYFYQPAVKAGTLDTFIKFSHSHNKNVCKYNTLLQTRAEKDPRDRAEQWQPQTHNTVNAKLEAIRDSFTSFSSISEVNTYTR